MVRYRGVDNREGGELGNDVRYFIWIRNYNFKGFMKLFVWNIVLINKLYFCGIEIFNCFIGTDIFVVIVYVLDCGVNLN